MNENNKIDLLQISKPVFLKGDYEIAYRDPAAYYHEGVFYVFHTLVRKEGKRDVRYFYLAVTKSEDLIKWSTPKIISPRNRNLNYSSPGNIIKYRGKFILCFQSYPTPNNEMVGNEDARIWKMESKDLCNWNKQDIMKVKGPEVPVEEMGRMIDPYLIQDKDNPDRWLCFYKQNGASISYSYDLEEWTYYGNIDAGENVCVLIKNNRYILFHHPHDRIGVKKSSNLMEWKDLGVITLGQHNWPWAQGRLTAANVLDLKQSQVGKYLMFFHGSSKEGAKQKDAHGCASLALAWSDDLINWDWPGK